MTKWILLIGGALALSGCGEPVPSPQKATALPAGTKLVLARTRISDMKAVGAQVTTRDQADARARIPGTLASLSVHEGDMVTKGQKIGMIVDSRLGFETSAYDAQVAAAEAEAARARGDLVRVQDLYDNKVYAKARLDQAVATARAADAQAAAARAQRGASASVIGQGAVLAPASGRVLRADLPAGSVVAPGMSVATITAGPPVLRLELPESLADRIRVGTAVAVAPGDLPEEARIGRVSQVYPAVREGQIRVDATLPGLPTRFIGRRVAASIAVSEREALVVPRRFVVTRYGIDQVDIVTPNGTLTAVPVQTAPTADPDIVEILSGAAPGDTLVAHGSAR